MYVHRNKGNLSPLTSFAFLYSQRKRPYVTTVMLHSEQRFQTITRQLRCFPFNSRCFRPSEQSQSRVLATVKQIIKCQEAFPFPAGYRDRLVPTPLYFPPFFSVSSFCAMPK